MAKRPGIHINLSDDLRKEFKSVCAQLDTTMTEVVCELIKQWIEENKATATETIDSIKELIRQNYFQLINGGINQERLQELAFGEKPLAKEREKIKKILGLDELPEN
ncbi:MAG: hypothetical protein F6J89_29095 [Symploca sp. SIO1C4]|uniref:Uncharacterized protein n=1 Tax=Symploca sp. SIO1C4 TaxID=2607765 RepID=A0A6B3NKX9_9CYAN|nr:hypothetical protein [Symploca sp. SIO1C4]